MAATANDYNSYHPWMVAKTSWIGFKFHALASDNTIGIYNILGQIKRTD